MKPKRKTKQSGVKAAGASSPTPPKAAIARTAARVRGSRRLFVVRATGVELCEISGMKPRQQSWRVWAALLALAVGCFSTLAQATNSPATNGLARAESHAPKLDFSSFQIIADRNIFDANRAGVPQAVVRHVIQVDYFALVGTLSYDKGTFAFFQGSSPDYTKVLKADGTIAGFKLAQIEHDCVQLEAGGKEVKLPVGSQLRREDAGEWQVSEANSSSYASSRESRSNSRFNRNGDSNSRRDYRSRRGGESRYGSNNNSVGSTTTTSTTSTADTSDVLKRLQEQRQKTLQ